MKNTIEQRIGEIEKAVTWLIRLKLHEDGYDLSPGIHEDEFIKGFNRSMENAVSMHDIDIPTQ